jgi:Domain of Unknown Function (DUF1080)
MRTRSVSAIVLLGALAALTLAPASAEQQNVKDGWIQLFNGRDLTGWKLRTPDGPNGWKVADGVYVNTPPSTDLVTEQSFYDFDLYVELKPAANTNSGLYLRDIYEVQIADSHGKPMSESMCGALYRRVAPAINACKPAGEWQTFEITFAGRRLTVVHNGQKLHDAIDVGPLGTGAAGKRADAPGPLRLQGDHQEVSFRNIRIRPREAK